MPIPPCIQLARTLLLALVAPCFHGRLNLLFPAWLAPSSFLVSGQTQIYADKLEIWVWINRVGADSLDCFIIHQILQCIGHKTGSVLSSEEFFCHLLSSLCFHFPRDEKVEGHGSGCSFEFKWCQITSTPF